MIICLAQIKPIKGCIEANIESHWRFVDLAAEANANFILFPELSLTGYEPTLVKDLAITTEDNRIAVFQKRSDEYNLTIAVGAPLRNDTGIIISLLIFSPHKEITTYGKQYLHADEEPFFIPAQNNAALFDKKEKIALAICYELSVSAHAEAAASSGAKLYLASVAKTAEGMRKADDRLSQVAKQYGMTTAVVNCLGENDGVVCSGQSAVWGLDGKPLGRLNENQEGILLLDTITKQTKEHYIR